MNKATVKQIVITAVGAAIGMVFLTGIFGKIKTATGINL